MLMSRTIMAGLAGALVMGAAGFGLGAVLVEPEVVIETKEVQVEREVVPSVCINALQTARDHATEAGNGVEVLSEWPDIAARSLMAGADRDVNALNEITADIDSINRRTDAASARIGRIGQRFIEQAGECQDLYAQGEGR